MKTSDWQKVVEPIISSIEQMITNNEQVSWTCPWRKVNTASRSVATSKPYTGINAVLCMIDRFENPQNSPIYGTFNQWKALNLFPRKGEKALWLTFYTPHTFTKVNDAGDEVSKTIAYSKAFAVFNSSQLDGKYEYDSGFDAPPSFVDEAVERKVMDDISFIPISYGGNRAAYSRNDHIVMPHRVQFTDDQSFWGTLLHEVVHSTGHASRLNRFDDDPSHWEFGSETYAEEELVAELGSFMALLAYGIASSPKPESVAYLKLWAERGRKDPKLFVNAASKASKAADFIVNHVRPGGKEEDGMVLQSVLETAAH